MVEIKKKSKLQELKEKRDLERQKNEIGKADKLYDKLIELKGEDLNDADRMYYREILNKYFN